MNLRIFFDPIPSSVCDKVYEPGDIFHFIRKNADDFPDWTDADIALIGISEEKTKPSADHVRERFYRLKQSSDHWKITDLGNLRPGKNEEDTGSRLQEVLSILLSQNVVPIIIGKKHSYDIRQFQAFDENEEVTMVSVDAFLDLYDNLGPERSHLHSIFSKKMRLFHYGHLGYQSFLVEQQHLNLLEKMHYDMVRIGRLKNEPEEAEPVLRKSNLLSFDISAIRVSDAPASTNPQPFGLTGEEACRLAWYAGVSPSLKSFGLYGYLPEKDENQLTASVLGTMIWYFAEGFYHRKPFLQKNESGMHRYVVPLSEYPHEIVFYKETAAERWWLEIQDSKKEKTFLVPCSYKDYKEANEGEVPNRFIAATAKYQS